MLMPEQPHVPVDAPRPAGAEASFAELVRRLGEAANGDVGEASRWQALAALYPELRKIASSQMAMQTRAQTMQVTSLVHEAALRLYGAEGAEWKSATHFFAFVTVVMRRILIDHARLRKNHRTFVSECAELDDDLERLQRSVSGSLDVLDAALERLRAFDPVGAEMVDLRFFGGWSVEAAAEAVGLPKRTAERKWTRVRAWLSQEMQSDS